MDKFERPAEPASLAAARQDLGNKYKEREAADIWSLFYGRDAYEEIRNTLLAVSQDTCAFCAGGFAQSTPSIEHFAPKSGHHAKPEKVLYWRNLFPACNACQNHKGSKYSGNLLKPDHSEYTPEKFFILEPSDGSLAPLPQADPQQQAMAQATIETYGLQRAALKKERRKALQQFERAQALEDYRFIERLFA